MRVVRLLLPHLERVGIQIVDVGRQLFAATRSPAVQGAIAEIFIRSNVTSASMPKLSSVLREHHIRPAGAGQDLVGLLLAKLSGA